MKSERQMSTRVSARVVAELRAESARKGLAQNKIAAGLGMSQSSISEKYRGLTALTVDQFVAWCGLLDVDPGDVLRVALASVPRLRAVASDRCREPGDGSEAEEP